ncbi:MAG: hypothetical protein P8Z30_16145 [Acidobacteriota bacterium]
MRESHEFKIECSRLSQDSSQLMECPTAGAGQETPAAVQPVETSRTSRRPGRAVACLLGALLVVAAMLGAPAVSSARIHVGIMVSFGPPALPYYVQPPCPGPGYIWTPGYWAWSPGYGYYWVPGTWVPAPFVGALWTPGYWDFDDGGYRWHRGYWGLSVGFYGGINYGYGYTGFGYHGGYWNHGRFYYNRAVNRIIGRNFRHFYYRREDRHFRGRRISFHGGPGGIHVRPTRRQLAVRRMRHFGPVREQMRQERFARTRPEQRASFNHGRPGIGATRRPGEFRSFHNDRAHRSAPDRHQNWQRFQRAQSHAAPRYAAPRGQVQRRGPERQYARRPARGRDVQRSGYQARRQETRRPQREAAPQRQRSNQRQAQHGGNQGHGKDHGRGQEHGHGQGGRR